jgi:hypothetical protein
VKAKSGGRLVDRVGLGVLASQFPDALIERVIEETGKREQRSRDLPAALMARVPCQNSQFGL